ncbi:MAG: lysophospholipid acyltransferase family protein [Chloroflexota bacterium]
MLRWIVQKTLYILFRILTRLTIIGLDNLPLTGACIMVTNHLSVLDAPLIFVCLQRKDLAVLVAKKHYKNLFFRFIASQAKVIWIDRFILEVKPLKEISTYLKNGGIIGIAPEGTRSRTYQMIEAKTGAAYLASLSPDAPIIPIAISGSDGAVPKLLRLARPKISIQFGTPFRLPGVDRQDRHAGLQRNTIEIMCRIAAMLPEKYHGFYAGHPRIKELISTAETNI